MAFDIMAHATATARAILRALTEAHLAGRTPRGIVLDEVTRKGLEEAGLGYWSGGAGTWSLFNVPVVIGPVQGWSLDLT